MNDLPGINPKRLGLFGGTFDPIHIGHLIVAEWVADALNLEKVIFIPNYSHPFHKRKNISDGQIRWEMIRLAVEDYEHFDCSDFELRQKGVSYTVDTLEHFINHYKSYDIYFILGDDNLETFSKWKHPQRILKLSRLAVYRRAPSPPENPYESDRFVKIDTPLIQISSSLIRSRISRNRSVKTMLPQKVYDFIKVRNLYVNNHE